MKRFSAALGIRFARLMGESRGALPLVLLGIALILGASTTTRAAVVACPTNTTLDVLINFNSLPNACFSQNVLFWNFSYTPGGNASAASNVAANVIFQNGSSAADMHGWNFSSSWSQSGAALANFTLSYKIEVCPSSGLPCSSNVSPGTLINAADAVYAPVSVFTAGPVTVNWSNGATVTLTSGSPGPLPGNGNIGLGAGTSSPITVTESFSGAGAITQTSLRFYENIPAIPEPTTGLLLGSGLAGLALVGARRPRV